MQSFRTGLLLAALMFLPALAAPAVAAPPMTKSEVSLVLLEVRLDDQLLSDGLSAYQFGGDVFLPLGEMARLLTLAIRVTPGDGRADGYLLTEDRNFSLDVPFGEVRISGRRELLDPAMVKVEADEIYVAARVLARWLPVDLELDLPSLTLKVRPREQLPLQARLARRERDKQPGTPGASADPGYARQATPYRLAGMPFIDQTLGVAAASNDGHARAETAYTAYLTADLLGMEAALYASRNRLDPSAGLRLTLGRHDPDAGLLGPLRARSALFGSVTLPGVANISANSATGNGIAISNRPLDQPTRFDSHSLQGDLPPGWDVELYYNEALVGARQSRADGKYSFDDQPLAYGPNDFRLVFHGPLGQLRVERQSFLLEQSAVAPGAMYYDVAGHRDLEGRARSVAQFEWGVSEHLSAAAGLVRVPVWEGEQRYANLGLRAYLQSFILSGDVVQADNGGKLAQVGVKTRVAGLALSASRAMLKDFTSELFFPTFDPVRARDELRIDGAFTKGALALPIALQVRRDTLESNAKNIEVQGRISAYQNGTAVSNALRWQSFDGRKVADGLLQVSRRVAGIGLSGQLQYTITPHAALGSVGLTADHYLADGSVANLALVRSFDTKESRLTGSLNKNLGSFGLGLNAFYSNHHEFGVGIQLFMAMGIEPRGARLLTEAQPMAGMGSASMRVFLDKNGNGVMDAGEEPIKGAGFTINGGSQLARTDDAGIAWLNHLPASQNVDIGLDPNTLDDPQWQPQRKGVRIVPRPGKVSEVDFAVSTTGEVDGTTYFVTNGAKKPIGDLKLELVDAAARVVADVSSASDGYYVLTGIFPGNYLLRVAPEQLKRLGLAHTGVQSITIERDGTVLNGRDLYVTSGPQ